MKPGDIYRSKKPRDDDYDVVQVGGFVRLSEDADDVEVTFAPTGGRFGTTVSTTPEHFRAQFEPYTDADRKFGDVLEEVSAWETPVEELRDG